MCGKWLKYVGEMTELFDKRQNIWEMAKMHGAWLQYLREGFTLLEMAEEFDKRLKYV